MFSRFEVTGHSMEPTLREGDRVFVFNSKNIKEGDLVVAAVHDFSAIKRVEKICENKIILKGDNNCSASFTVDKEDILGKVLFTY